MLKLNTELMCLRRMLENVHKQGLQCFGCEITVYQSPILAEFRKPENDLLVHGVCLLFVCLSLSVCFISCEDFKVTRFFPSYIITGKNHTGAVQTCGDGAFLRKSSSPRSKKLNTMDLRLSGVFLFPVMRCISCLIETLCPGRILLTVDVK